MRTKQKRQKQYTEPNLFSMAIDGIIDCINLSILGIKGIIKAIRWITGTIKTHQSKKEKTEETHFVKEETEFKEI